MKTYFFKFFGSGILKDCIKVQEKKKKVVVRLFPSSTKREIRQFHVVEKCTKKRDARAKLLFCLSKSTAFLLYSLPSPSWLLKLTNIHT